MISQWGFWGIVVCVVVAAIGILCYGTYWGEWKLASSAAGILLIFAFAGVWDYRAERVGPRPLTCNHQLKQIGIALHNYHDEYGCFPPSYIADASGQPMHSWRVLLLRYMDFEGQRFYQRYNFNEPWDGPNNSKLAAEMPNVYRCADLPRGSTTNTAFLAVVGPTTMWPASGKVRRDDIRDGLEQTLAVVEVENSGVNWLEPRDLQLARVPLAADSRRSHGIASPHEHAGDGQRGTWGVFADGSVYFLRYEISAEKLRALLTIDGRDNAQFSRE